MRTNNVREKWRKGEAIVNGWLQIPSTWTAEVMAHQGWDSLVIDLQHGLIGYDMALGMLQAISTTDVTPLARAPWNEPSMIMKLLDAGAQGIICPMVNTRAEAEAFVGACRYAPQGYRSVGPTRATIYAGSDYIDAANSTVVTMAMIETAQAIQNVDEIMSTPGLDGIYIGPSDLGLSLGVKAAGPIDRPILAEAIDKALQAAKKHGILAGIHTSSTNDAIHMLQAGFGFVTILNDTRLLASMAKAVTDTVHDRKLAP